MIKNIKLNCDREHIFLFDEIKNLKQVNLLFGGNGVGKTSFLKGIRNLDFELKNDYDKANKDDLIIKSYTNSLDNSKTNKRKEVKTKEDIVKALNSSEYSEGQSILFHLLSFLADVEDINSDKQIIVLLDEIDSGLSAENINVVIWRIKELTDKNKNIQFFISTNDYHWIYVYKEVVNMYTGEYIKIDSYDNYYKLLSEGIQILAKSGKRNFDFLQIV